MKRLLCCTVAFCGAPFGSIFSIPVHEVSFRVTSTFVLVRLSCTHLWFYGIVHMVNDWGVASGWTEWTGAPNQNEPQNQSPVNDRSDSERGNPMPPHRGLLFPVRSKGSCMCTITQTE